MVASAAAWAGCTWPASETTTTCTCSSKPTPLTSRWRRLTLPGCILARAFAIEPNGLTLYLPDPGTAAALRQHRHHVTYQLATPITDVAAGSSGAQVLRGRKFYAAVRASGATPASFYFRDEVNKRLWTLPLPELGNAETRGLGVSGTGDTLIFCTWNGLGIHRYVRVRAGGPVAPAGPIRTYRIAQVRPVRPGRARWPTTRAPRWPPATPARPASFSSTPTPPAASCAWKAPPAKPSASWKS